MLLAIDKHAALYVFNSVEDAERDLEAIDVQQDTFEFCDLHGQRYSPAFTRQPKERRFGPLGAIDVGTFKLVAEGDIDVGLPKRFIERAEHIEHSSIPAISSIEALRLKLPSGA